jgi:PAS domain S-box-containing protein
MKKILVIDEDGPLRIAVLAELRRNGFEALGAADAAEGLALALAQQPSLVLCDRKVSGRSGLDVLRELRIQPATSSIPVIMMTGAVEQADARLSLDPGADDYLVKPFALETMLALVQARLERLDGIQRAVAAKPQPEPISAHKKLGEAAGVDGEVHQMTARGFRNILQVVVLVFVFTLVQMSGLQWVCNHGMQVAQSLEHQGLPNLNQLAALREHLILFRLYAYEYLFAREKERPRLAQAVTEAANQTQADLAEIQKLLHDPRGQQLANALGTSFAELAREFDRVHGLVDNDFTGAMAAVDHDVPPMIQKVDAAATKLNEFGYQFSTVQANATFHSFESIKNGAIVFGIVNMIVALGLLLFVRRAARKTRSQLLKALDQLSEQARALRLQTSALEAAANGIAIAQRNGNIVWVNRAFTRLTGYAIEEVVGKNPRVLKSGRHAPEFYTDMWATINAGKVWHGELVNRRKDGSFYDEEMTITPVVGEDGMVQNFIAIKQDVSERKRNQQLLTCERDLLQSLMDNLPDFIFFKDANSRFTRINLALARHLGLSKPEAAIGKSDADFFPIRAARQKQVDERRLLATGKPVQDLVEKSDRAGTTKWVSSTKVPLYGEDGKISGLVGISHDVTARKLAEEELQRKTTFLEAQLNSSPDGILVVDEEGKKTQQNQRLVTMFKIPPAIADDADDEKQRQWIMRQAKNPEQFIQRLLYLNNHREEVSREEIELQDGTALDRYTAPLVGKDGKYYGRLWTFRDITQRKRKEEERQLMELQLRQSQKLETVGQLAAGIAHEINTPTQYVGDNTRFVKDSFAAICSVLKSHEELLASARNNVITPELVARSEALLLASDLDYLYTQIPAALEETLEGVERVTKIVRAMKDFSHPGGQGKTPADVNRAIESTVTVARNEWKYVADLNLELQSDLPPVPCFIGEFNQTILNLVVNAAHAIGDVVNATPGTKGCITIRTRRDGDQVEVRVTDTGTGIAEANRPKIFAPFFTTKDVGKGTGQGLSIVYGSIVKRHGGSVKFETEVGKGTTFIIRLPISPLLPTEANPSRPVELATS